MSGYQVIRSSPLRSVCLTHFLDFRTLLEMKIERAAKTNTIIEESKANYYVGKI